MKKCPDQAETFHQKEITFLFNHIWFNRSFKFNYYTWAQTEQYNMIIIIFR